MSGIIITDQEISKVKKKKKTKKKKERQRGAIHFYGKKGSN
jgi:hypothetical protein